MLRRLHPARRRLVELRARQPERGAGPRHAAQAAVGVRCDGGRRVHRRGLRGGVRRRCCLVPRRGRRPGRRVHDLRPAHRGLPDQPRPRREPLPHLRPHRLQRHSLRRRLRLCPPVLAPLLPGRRPLRVCPRGPRGSSTRSRASSGRTPTPTSCAPRPRPGAPRRSRSPTSRPTAPRRSTPSRSSAPPRSRSPSRSPPAWPTAAARSVTSAPSLAQACDDYADHVDEQRAAILDLLHDLLRDAVIIEGIGIVLGTITGGATAAAATALNAARIAAVAPRLLRIISTLRSLASTCAAPLRYAAIALRDIRVELSVFRRARLTVASAFDAERLARVERLRGLVNSPRLFESKRPGGLSPKQIEKTAGMTGPSGRPARVQGIVYETRMPTRSSDPRDGRLPAGSRPDPITWGPYAVISQNGGTIKIPLEGNPTPVTTPVRPASRGTRRDLHAGEQLSLYEFSWFLRGLKRGLTEDEIADICQQAYDEIDSTASHSTWSGSTGRSPTRDRPSRRSRHAPGLRHQHQGHDRQPVPGARAGSGRAQVAAQPDHQAALGHRQCWCGAQVSVTRGGHGLDGVPWSGPWPG